MRPLSVPAVVAVVVASLLAACNPWRVFVPSEATHFRAREVAVDGARRRYQVHVPSPRPAGRLPVVVFLHGSGEVGDDGVKQTQVGLGPELWRRGGAFPFLVVLPQCPRGALWTSPAVERAALAALDAAIAEFGGDADRVYLVGNSLGGYGTWALGARHPDRFAALVPVAGAATRPGWTPYPDDARLVPKGEDPRPVVAKAVAEARLPVWILHGDEDDVVPVREARAMRDLLRTLGVDPGDLRYTEWPGAGHAASWERTWPRDELWDWLLTRRRSDR